MKKLFKLIVYALLFTCSFGHASEAISDGHITEKTPGLLIKIPTRSRPDKFFGILDKYYQLLSKQVRCIFLITCDNDDPQMNNENCKQRLSQYPNLAVRFSDNHSKIEAYNKDVDEFINDWDVILVTSDDMEPVLQDYDKIIMDTMQAQFPDYDGVLNFSDGYFTDVLNTYPIIGKKFYQRFGYTYHPSYKSLVCDLELSMVTKILKKEYVDNRILIRHNHPSNGSGTWDALYYRNEQLMSVDAPNFFQRRCANYNLSEEELNSACTKTLSIIIGAISNNASRVGSAYAEIERQVTGLGLTNEVELLRFHPNQQFDAETNRMLAQTSGRYVCFVNADFVISPEYVQLIYKHCAEDAQIMAMSIANRSGNVIRKQSILHHPCSVNFLNPVKRYLAVQFNSPDNRWGSGEKWGRHLTSTGVLKYEAALEKPLYRNG